MQLPINSCNTQLCYNVTQMLWDFFFPEGYYSMPSWSSTAELLNQYKSDNVGHLRDTAIAGTSGTDWKETSDDLPGLSLSKWFQEIQTALLHSVTLQTLLIYQYTQKYTLQLCSVNYADLKIIFCTLFSFFMLLRFSAMLV